ncbi:MAG: shikimate kinase AroK [Gammaproteobacteria bacterium]|nr:shikimate kinase AroK [Gammaproteobacteria bacterium]
MSASTARIPSRIILIGPMGAGKTTVGLRLAEALDKNFLDSDKEIERKTGASIPLIFELEGEQGFRNRECEAIDQLTQEENIILATGGGSILDPKNRNFMKERGYVIYLQAPLDQLLERTAKDKNRPLLQTSDPRKTLGDIIKKREPLYLQTADLVYKTNNKQIREVISNILELLAKNNQKTTA